MKKLIATILIMQAWGVTAATEFGCDRSVISAQTLVLASNRIGFGNITDVNICVAGPPGVTLDPQFNTTIRAGEHTLTLKATGKKRCSTTMDGSVDGHYADYKVSGNGNPSQSPYFIVVNIPYQDKDIRGYVTLYQGINNIGVYDVIRSRQTISMEGIRATVTYQDMAVEPGLTPMRVNYTGWGTTSLPSIKYDIRPSAADGLSVLFDNGGTSLTQKTDAAPVINVKDNGAAVGQYTRVIDATLTCP